MTVVQGSLGDRARWNGYVQSARFASVYHRWEWGEIFEDVYGVRFFPLMAVQDGVVTGVLPLVRLSSPMFGTSLVSMPYFGHGGALADDDGTWHDLIAAARVLSIEVGARHVELRHGHPVPTHALTRREDKALMRLSLPDSMDELLKRVGPKARADIRRPEKEGITAHVGGDELIPEFHSAYASVMRDLGSPCHAEKLFREMHRRMADRSFVVVTRYQGRCVGGGFLVGMGDTLEIPVAGSLHALSRLRGNMLLYATILREAIHRGYQSFSFGRSSTDSGTFAFKKNWGALPVPLPYDYILAPGTTLATPDPHAPRYQKVIAAWQRLPVALATWAGPRVVRYLA